MPLSPPPRTAFTLLELLMVIAVVGILFGMVLTRSEPNVDDQLRAAAAIVASDLEYGRSLAVANGDTYRFTFDGQNNQYVLQYSGSNSALNTLPATPFRSTSDPANQYIVSLANLPHLGKPVALCAAGTASSSAPQQVTTLEFQPLGGTTCSGTTYVWLAAGRSPNNRYIAVTVDPTTGLAASGTYSSTGPPASFTTYNN
jgi:prepilin-type N-terminal cleavage/methylation domain-containing protein